MRSLRHSIAVLALCVPLAGPAAALDRPGDKAPPSQCGFAYDDCMFACTRRHAQDDAARVGCTARCAADHATCEAQAQYNAAKPWLDEQVDKMRRFYDGFKGEQSPPPPPDAPPREPDRDPNTPGGKPI